MPQQNCAKVGICKLKRKWHLKMRQQGIPRRLWDYSLVWASEIINQMAWGPDWQTPYEEIMGNTPDISKWLDFQFYNWCWYWTGPTHKLTKDKANIGRLLGMAHCIGSDIWLLLDLNPNRDCLSIYNGTACHKQ